MKKGKASISYADLLTASYGRLFLILSCTVFLTGGNVFLRWCIGDALDNGNLSLLLPAAAVVLLAVTQILGYARQMLSAGIQKNIYHRLQTKVLHSTLEGLEKKDMGIITTCYVTDVNQLNGFIMRILNKAFPDGVSWLITVGLLFYFNVFLGLAAVAVTVFPALFTHRMSRPVAKGMDEYQTALEAANQSVASGMHNIETIKASCKEEAFLRDSREKLALLQKKKCAVAFREAVLGAPMLLSAFLTIILLTALGGWLVLAERITGGQLLTVVTLIDNITSFVMGLDGTLTAFRRASVCRGRLNEFLKMEDEPGGEQEAGEIKSIVFRQIHFSYPDTGTEIYNGFSESWERGKLYLIKGVNGAGKSTLVKLLMGIYPLSGGEILINGIPSQKYRLKSLRERIVVVPQENMLFRGSIYDNLTCGANMRPEKVEAMCRKLDIHEEIMNMPEQYDTILTENGGVLSGGQKQRLCLARALLREGDVYIFDEPTSALDGHRSRLLTEVLEELSLEKIVVEITHEKDLPDSEHCALMAGGLAE